MNLDPTASTPRYIGRLSLMMFLQYAIWGAWLPILFPYLLGHAKFSLDQVGAILAAGAVGSIFGPFIAGQIADRYFNTEKYLGMSYTELIPVLINAIQEQQKTIETLKAQVSSLQNKNEVETNEIKAELEEIKKILNIEIDFNHCVHGSTCLHNIRIATLSYY